MDTTASKRYFQIACINIRYNFLPHLGLALMILLITPPIFGVTNLDDRAACIPLEMFVVLTGIILLTPVFAPEQADAVGETVEAKYTGHMSVILVRILYSFLVMVLLIFSFTLLMKINGSRVSTGIALGTIAGATFLGALGILANGVSGNIAVGYMAPMIWYILCFAGGDKLGMFYLFSMSQGSFIEKAWLFGSGAGLIAVTLLIKSFIRKSR